MTHTCAAPTCDRTINDRYLMCPEHWRLVPEGIADELTRAWRAYERSHYRAPERSRLRAEFLAARRRAVESV